MTSRPAVGDTTGFLINQSYRVLKEAFEGPPGPWSYFTDRAPVPGILSTLGKLTPETVSRPAGSGGSTIAGHVQHLVSTLPMYAQWIRGETVSRDRSRSWTVKAVDQRGWTELQRELREAYEQLSVTIEMQRDWSEDSLGGALGAIGHVAYHVGAIRQRLVMFAVTTPPS